MRFTGHLFFDVSHKPCTGTTPHASSRRISAWEIHPVSGIEVCINTSPQAVRGPKRANGNQSTSGWRRWSPVGRSPLVARCTELSSLAPGVVHPPKSLCDSCCSHSTTAGLSCSPQLPRVGIHGNSGFLMFFVNFHWSGELVCSLRCHTNICSERQASVEAVRLPISYVRTRTRVPVVMGSMRNDDEAFRSAPLRLLPFCGERRGCNEHMARCLGALLALSDMRTRLAIESGRTTGVQSARWSRGPTQSHSHGPARSAALTRGPHPWSSREKRWRL
jgi:hypothetical protein